jgi:hypothetical protein
VGKVGPVVCKPLAVLKFASAVMERRLLKRLWKLREVVRIESLYVDGFIYLLLK